MMEVIVKNKRVETNFFEDLENSNIIEMLFIQVLISECQQRKYKISIREISYNVLAEYWQLDLSSYKHTQNLTLLNSIRSKLISKYGLTLDSSIEEITQILGYAADRTIDIELYGIIKGSLKKYENVFEKEVLNENNLAKWKAYLSTFRITNGHLYKLSSNQYLEINQEWMRYIKTIHGFSLNNLNTKEADELKPDGINNDKIQEKLIQSKNSNPYELLDKTEKRMQLQMNLNKKAYSCLEEALSWLNLNMDKFTEIHELYIVHLCQNSARGSSIKYPLVTSMLLIYTAVYRYNEEDSSGFWPEFFGGDNNYSYQRDVAPVMNTLEMMKKRYLINTQKRHYLQKSNLSEIFSQIYLPEVSLKKIFSALYSYYFKANRNSRIYNLIDFIEMNEYRLDKPGSFFLKDDQIIEGTFDKLIELLDLGINNSGNIDNHIDLPSRFFDTFKDWSIYDKKIIDNKKEEFYISVPKVKFDIANESIILSLPKQKSRVFSDEDFGWKVTIDGDEKFITGRIIRLSSGSYLVLDEYMELIKFGKIDIEYIFNEKVLGKWEYVCDENYILFDQYGVLLQKNTVKRDGCIIGLKKSVDFNNKEVEGKLENTKWNDYYFYNLSFKNYQTTQYYIDIGLTLQIEDRPIIERNNFKAVFENSNTLPMNDSVSIYESFGGIQLTSPEIQTSNFEVRLVDLDRKIDKEITEYLKKENTQLLTLNLDFLLNAGTYTLSIRYKNKPIYRESFILYKGLKMTNDFDLSYHQVDNVHKEITIVKSDEIEILANHYETRVYENEQKYIIEPINTAVAKFLFKVFNRESYINTIIRPIKVDVIGLDEVIEQNSNKKVLEITKSIFNKEDIRLQVTNYDNRSEWLEYQLLFDSQGKDCSFTESRRLKFGDDFTWQLNAYKDRVVDFDLLSISINVINQDGEIIYRQKYIEVTQKITLLDFKKAYVEDRLSLSWRENQTNSDRILYLFNFTVPSEKPIKFDLDDGRTDIEIDLKQLKFGVYVPIVDFRKKESVFENLDTERKFFKSVEVKNYFVNKHGYKSTTQEVNFCKIIWNFMRTKYDDNLKPFDKIDMKYIDLYNLFCTLIQLKYSVNQSEQTEMEQLILINKVIMRHLVVFYNKDELLDRVHLMRNELKHEDVLYLVMLVLSYEPTKSITEENLEKLAQFDLIDALCAVSNGAGRLPANLITKCKETFDHELLGSVRDHKTIYNIIQTEVEMISGFWNWITDHRNNYILKYAYSKARMFRIYEHENGLSTYKVIGRMVDDLVDNMISEKNCIVPRIPQRWSSKMNIDQDIFREFNHLMQTQMSENYKEIIKGAFISVSHLDSYSNDEYFELMMRCHFSKRKDMFDRYRAYFKLIFI